MHCVVVMLYICFVCPGAVYVFRSDADGRGWSQVSVLSKSTEPIYGNDYFGWSVCVYGNIVSASPLYETVSGMTTAGKLIASCLAVA